ncbi:hypothetical protein [Paraburkholderia sp. SOS3]|jgi:hypothetical protein|uniref:hypothetical protein n=1 Tax=Paraburkholderia sp. SOS3 TaxID=1926494 RepID=UPI000A620BF6|nr:hypothetical protein [Paraburkholderia sp. SOS3]
MRLLVTQDGLPRVSWGAVFTGVVISLVVYLVMSVLGTAIGASLLNPLSRPDPARAFGFGSGVWLIVTTVVSVFAGAYFAGRCAPVLGWMHGLLAWAVMILFVVFGMASVIGGAIGVAGNVASAGATAGAAAGQSKAGNEAIDNLTQQARSAIASVTEAASSPQAQADARQVADSAARTVARASWFSVAGLFVGAVIALGAGALGFRHQPTVERGTKTGPAYAGGVPLADGPAGDMGRRVR